MPRILAVDWTGARTGERRALWLAETRQGALVRLECGRSREELVAHLLEEAARDPKLVVGLDFAFSFPGWFLEARGIGEVTNAWELVSREAEAWLADPQPPFWRVRKPPGHVAFRKTELECGGRPKSVFQLVGAGQVGTGSLRGMPFLRRLRERFAIWPFDEPRLPLVVEIYPRLYRSQRIDRSFQTDARAEPARPECRHRKRCLSGLHRAQYEDSRGYPNEHARDAACSALAMSRWAGDWRRLPIDPECALEGRIWHDRLVLGGS